MGTGNSRLESRPCRPRVNRSITRSRFLSSLVCGGSSSSSRPVMDDRPAELQAYSTEGHNSVVLDELQSSNKEDTLTLCPEIESPHSTIDAPSNSSNDGKSSSESKDLVREVLTDNHGPLKPYSERTCDLGSSSSAERQSPQAAVFEADNSKNKGSSQIFPEESSSSTSHQEPEDSCVDRVLTTVYPPNDVLGVQSSETSSFPSFSNSSSLLTPQPRSEETAQETNATGAGFLMLDSGREGSGNVLHVDVVSISSGSLFSGTREVSNREVRRNSRRLFWDAFSRRGSRRDTDSRTIFFSSEAADDLEFQDRWLLDFSGDLFEDSVGSDSGHLGSRSHGMYEGRWHSRSEIWDRFRGGRDESSQQTAFCASGLHPDGTCSCESFLTAEESGTRGSISRIVMLAEALFEVLDEIHRQPSSLSLSMVSVPAPESIVSRFPLKSHKKPCTAECGDDAEQCYICLSEYEDGDKVRILPCHHEYHMSCVDKWLTEIHGVCPLCRRDVCLGASNVSISNSG